jgi:hypothetical protein
LDEARFSDAGLAYHREEVRLSGLSGPAEGSHGLLEFLLAPDHRTVNSEGHCLAIAELEDPPRGSVERGVNSDRAEGKAPRRVADQSLAGCGGLGERGAAIDGIAEEFAWRLGDHLAGGDADAYAQTVR